MVTTVADIDIDQLAGLKRKQIQSLCKKHGIRANGKTEELIEHLTAYAKDGSKPSDPTDEQQGGDEEEQDKDSSEAPEEASPAPESEQTIEASAPCFTEEAVDEVTEKDVREATNDVAGLPTEETVEATEEAAGETVDETTEVATKDPVEVVANETVEETTEESINETTEEATEESIEEAAEETTEETTEETSEQTVEETTEDSVKEVSTATSPPISDEPRVAEDKSSTVDMALMTPKKTDNAKSEPKTLAFDRIHQNMFNNGDSIANHWSVKRTATPKAKRMDSEDAAPASNKRARIEPLFTSPGSKPQPAAQKCINTLTETSNLSATTEQPVDQQETSLSSTDETVVTTVVNTSEEESTNSADLAVVSSSTKADDATKTLIQKPTISKSSIGNRLSETSSLPSRIPQPKKSEQLAATNSTKDSKTDAKPANISSATNPRAVESKIKAYINAKPPSPKIKAVKHKVVDPKQLPKAAPVSKPAAVLSSDTKKKPKPSAVDNDGIPSYMRPTRATESRAQAHKPVSTKAPIKGGEENSSHNSNGRFKPYSRPSNPPTKKLDTDKSAMPKPVLPSAK